MNNLFVLWLSNKHTYIQWYAKRLSSARLALNIVFSFQLIIGLSVFLCSPELTTAFTPSIPPKLINYVDDDNVGDDLYEMTSYSSCVVSPKTFSIFQQNFFMREMSKSFVKQYFHIIKSVSSAIRMHWKGDFKIQWLKFFYLSPDNTSVK